MKKAILLLFVLGVIFIRPAKLIAEDVVESPCYYKESNKDCVKRLVSIFAKKYKVSASSMMRTLTNENNIFDFELQSYLRYKKGNRWKLPAGSREQSYGVAQIHLPDHPSITKEQATNPAFAIEFMAKKFAEGRQRMWMGYRG